MIRVLAIDPAMSCTGVALVDERGVSCACEIRPPEDHPKTDRSKLIARAELICERLDDLLIAWPHDVVVIEEFNIRSEVKGNAYAATQGIWLESWLCQHMSNEVIHTQLPNDALGPSRKFSAYWYLGINPRTVRKMSTEQKLLVLADAMPGGSNCHGRRDQIQAAAHGYKYVMDRQRLFG